MPDTPAPAATPDTILDRALLCVRAALEKKAFDVKLLDVRGLTSIGDYFVLLSGRSDTQVRAIAEAVETEVRRSGYKSMAIEGSQLGRWVLIDLGDILVHVFHQPVREFYDLERLWSKATAVALPADLAAAAQSNQAMAPGELGYSSEDLALTEPALFSPDALASDDDTGSLPH